MNHDPIQLLISEHDVIVSVKHKINESENTWQNSPDDYKKFVTRLIRFFRDYADKFHHFKEEDVLFPEMNKHPEFLHQDLINEIEEQHETFRTYLKEIEEYLANEKWESAHKKLLHYFDELQDHIAAENDEIFMMAKTLFTENELERMYFRFIDFDTEYGQTLKKELEGFGR
ncbi:MAG: hypothetical protein A3H98_06505 [Bacteroidetes bacterium RIFCSPLOWO2_02_FULL_36_8]|nr:MAG: hypothetical protein A3H98_06505 [Bacteroidetes bacterium RIFCSPLOWO2_02_FULL_36_8]OFY71115.1 MAG: hypothetical protein A3G23_15010 [Bacteroidetes bacterium RIFCSPLOWO2_12_FULL_37_12]